MCLETDYVTVIIYTSIIPLPESNAGAGAPFISMD